MADRGLLDLMITRLPGLRGNDRKRLAMKFDCEEDFLFCSRRDLEDFLGHTLGRKKWTYDAIRAQAAEDAKRAAQRGIKMVSLAEAAYPPLLREIFDPPALLFYRGSLPDPSKPMAAMVGTRQPSQSGSALAFSLGRQFGRAGIAVTSGLALGIDALAHRGNIEGGGPSAAVLGSGLDQVYPSSNRGLAGRLIEAGGCLVSEYPPGTPPYQSNFPARNRIISGLSRAVLVVEAPERSGALITARFALEQNRDLWVAGSPAPLGAGTTALAAQGAQIATSAWDILKELGIPMPEGEEAVTSGKSMAEKLAEQLDFKL